MTLSAALSNALSGLLTNQRQADVTAHNIANATTPGFSRREVQVDARVIREPGHVGLIAICRRFERVGDPLRPVGLSHCVRRREQDQRQSRDRSSHAGNC